MASINFILGVLYGSIEGYYGGAVDMVMERISDVLNSVPFMVVATCSSCTWRKRWACCHPCCSLSS